MNTTTLNINLISKVSNEKGEIIEVFSIFIEEFEELFQFSVNLITWKKLFHDAMTWQESKEKLEHRKQARKNIINSKEYKKYWF